jgi:hypothetical protein
MQHTKRFVVENSKENESSIFSDYIRKILLVFLFLKICTVTSYYIGFLLTKNMTKICKVAFLMTQIRD